MHDILCKLLYIHVIAAPLEVSKDNDKVIILIANIQISNDNDNNKVIMIMMILTAANIVMTSSSIICYSYT